VSEAAVGDEGPGALVVPGVAGAGLDGKIAGAIVELVAILVVNTLAGAKRLVEEDLHHEAVEEFGHRSDLGFRM